MARLRRKMRPAPLMMYRDSSGKFASRRGGRRRARRNPEGDPASKEADATLKAIAEKELAEKEAAAKRKEAARKAAETKARKKAEAADKAAKEAAAADKAAKSEKDAAMKEMYQAEAKRAEAEAKKALAEAKKAEKEAEQAAKPPRRKAITAKELSKQARSLRKRGSRVKDRGLKSVYRQRASALALRARAKNKKLSPRAQKAMKAHGLSRVNPLPASMQMQELMPKLFAAGITAGVGYMAGNFVAEKVVKSQSPFWQKYGAAISTLGLTGAAFMATRRKPYGSAVLMGGIAAAAVQLMKARETSAPPVTLVATPALANRVALRPLLDKKAVLRPMAGVPSAEAEGSLYVSQIEGVPSVEDFASPYAMQVLEETNAGSLKGTVF